jgi:uncharacterized membrane protein YvlD (DUF360 family)
MIFDSSTLISLIISSALVGFLVKKYFNAAINAALIGLVPTLYRGPKDVNSLFYYLWPYIIIGAISGIIGAIIATRIKEITK